MFKNIFRKIKNHSDKLEIIKLINDLDLIGHEYYIWVQLKKNIRSIPMNAMFWVWMTALETSSETGYDKYWFHNWLLACFPIYDIMEYKGERHILQLTTSMMDNKQLISFMEKIDRYALDTWGVTLLWPTDERFEDFFNEYKGK